MAKNVKDQSPLVASVLALDSHLADLERLGAKINEAQMKSDFDREQMRRLLTHFAEYGQNVAHEVTELSTHLNAARARAEEVAVGVAKRATELESRQADHKSQWDQFQALNERVRALNASISCLRRPEGVILSADEQDHLAASLGGLDLQLEPLIAEAERIRAQAQQTNVKLLEQNADALAQSLLAVRQKIRGLSVPVRH